MSNNVWRDRPELFGKRKPSPPRSSRRRESCCCRSWRPGLCPRRHNARSFFPSFPGRLAARTPGRPADHERQRRALGAAGAARTGASTEPMPAWPASAASAIELSTSMVEQSMISAPLPTAGTSSSQTEIDMVAGGQHGEDDVGAFRGPTRAYGDAGRPALACRSRPPRDRTR